MSEMDDLLHVITQSSTKVARKEKKKITYFL